MSKKIIDLTEYKNNQEDIEAMEEDIPEEILEAYMKEIDNNTPDLWTRIDAGYEKEINLINNENKARKRKIIGFVAAGVLITIIAVPIAVLSQIRNKDDNNKKSDMTTRSQDVFEEKYEEAEAGEETYDDSYEANYSDNDNNSGYLYNSDTTSNSVSGDLKEEDAASSVSYSDESLFASEVKIDENIYEISDEESIAELPENVGESISIENIYCDYPNPDYPDDVLTVYQMKDTDEYIYIKYFDMYKLYIKKAESSSHTN